MGFRILSVSDIVNPLIYSPSVRNKFSDIDFLISCGDLPPYYLEYLVSMLNVPLFFVHGNHDKSMDLHVQYGEKEYIGGENLHQKKIFFQGILIAGVEGCIKYREGPFLYTQSEMWWFIFYLVPQLMINKLKYGRYLDIFVTHAPAWGIHDQSDFAHQGIKAFRWFLKVFQPSYHFHGHIHIYKPLDCIDAYFGETKIINTYGYRITEI